MLNPGELTVFCEVTSKALGMQLDNVETNLKKVASAQNHRVFEQEEMCSHVSSSWVST